MFTKRHRFHGYGSLRGVYQHGQNIRGSLIGLKYTQRAEKHPYRVAVIVSRKVSKSAVVRNRIRRRVYEQVRLNDQSIKPGTDLVFTVYSDQLAEAESGKLKRQITELLKKTK